jgi:hypothetical protein
MQARRRRADVQMSAIQHGPKLTVMVVALFTSLTKRSTTRRQASLGQRETVLDSTICKQQKEGPFI